MNNLIHRFHVGLALPGLLFLTALALAPRAEAITPCCDIAGIHAKTGLVTARVTATGKTFQFKVNDMKLLRSLKVGQKVAADFGTQKVSVDGSVPCCEIVQPALKNLPNAVR